MNESTHLELLPAHLSFSRSKIEGIASEDAHLAARPLCCAHSLPIYIITRLCEKAVDQKSILVHSSTGLTSGWILSPIGERGRSYAATNVRRPRDALASFLVGDQITSNVTKVSAVFAVTTTCFVAWRLPLQMRSTLRPPINTPSYRAW
eukprot:COSAG01_NODE_4789_length_4742_cov_2.795822_4_plen_149_part_00